MHKVSRLALLTVLSIGMVLPFGLTGCGSAPASQQANLTPIGQSNVSISFPGGDAAHQLTITLNVD